MLGLLAQQPSAGYELGARAATSIAHFWPLTRTHIYTELERLEALGFATATIVAQQRLPDKRVYTTTPAGLRVLDAWLNDPDPGAYRRRHPMLIKLYFAAIVVEHDAALAADGERASVAAFPACDGAIRRTSGEGRSRLAGRAARCSTAPAAGRPTRAGSGRSS